MFEKYHLKFVRIKSCRTYQIVSQIWRKNIPHLHTLTHTRTWSWRGEEQVSSFSGMTTQSHRLCANSVNTSEKKAKEKPKDWVTKKSTSNKWDLNFVKRLNNYDGKHHQIHRWQSVENFCSSFYTWFFLKWHVMINTKRHEQINEQTIYQKREKIACTKSLCQCVIVQILI